MKTVNIFSTVLILLLAASCVGTPATDVVDKPSETPHQKPETITIPVATVPETAAPAKPEKPDTRFPIVVAAFNDLSGTNERMGEQVATLVLTALAENAANVRPVEREKLQALLGEMELSLSGLVDENSAPRLGALAGAKYLVFGTVGIFGDVWQITWRIISVETGDIVKAGRGKGTKTDLLTLADAAALAIDAALPKK